MGSKIGLKQALVLYAGLVALIVGALAVFGNRALVHQSDAADALVRQYGMLSASQQADMMHDALRGDVLRMARALSAGVAKDAADAGRDVNEHAATLRAAMDRIAQAADATVRRQADAVMPALDAYVAIALKVAAEALQDARALDRSYPEFQARFEALEKDMAALSGVIEKGTEQTRRAADDAEHRAILWGYLAAALGLLATIVAAAVFGRWLLRSLGGEPSVVVAAMRRLATGDLELRGEARAPHEGSIAAAADRVRTTIAAIVEAQQTMKTRHDEGTIGFRIDATGFSGAYRTMVENVNELVATHIAVKMRVVEVVKSYAEGDLSVAMDRLPGEKAAITQAMDAVRLSLQSINAEIQTLVEAASRGEFGVRGQAQNFRHDFRLMVTALNRLMEVSDSSLNEVARVLAAVARGDLTQRVSMALEGTFGKLKDDTNRTVESLTRIVSQIRGTTESITVTSKQIAHGNADLSQRTEQQAGSLEKTAASMGVLTSTVKQNARNARAASVLAIGASEVAGRGGDVVSRVVATMGSIDASSKKIVDIIAVIDSIAFQTNILALNAAVEAARAGEQGRGFAVVAAEVRNLAQRSAAAARQIKALITDSVDQVNSGTRLVGDAGATMTQVVESIRRVAAVVGEISGASREQSCGIDEVDRAIAQMDTTTQQNAALVEEAAAAAVSLREQADALLATVASFQVDASPAPTAEACPAGFVERRAAHRATNVTRLPSTRVSTGTAPATRSTESPPASRRIDDGWAEC